MNILKIISGGEVISKEKIAREIVTLENRLPEFLKATEDTKDTLMRLEQVDIFEKNISAAERTAAQNNFSQAKNRGEAIKTTIDGLRKRLLDQLEEERAFNQTKVDELREAIRKNTSDQKEELINASLEYLSLLQILNNHPKPKLVELIKGFIPNLQINEALDIYEKIGQRMPLLAKSYCSQGVSLKSQMNQSWEFVNGFTTPDQMADELLAKIRQEK